MNRNDGGPAFPVDCNWHNGVPTSGVQTSSKTGMATGMTMRDYFAAKAMAVLVPLPGLVEWDKGDIAREAYYYADAMLAARGDA